MKKRILALFCAVLVAGSFVACSNQQASESTTTIEAIQQDAKTSEENSSAETAAVSAETDSSTAAQEIKSAEEITIGVSFGQNVHPFFVAMEAGIKQAGEDLGIKKVNILSADSSLETQNSQIENLITMGCDVILLNPYDSEGVINAVKTANDAGVAVFTMDIDCTGSTAFIASDNHEIGKMLAEYVIEKLNDEGEIAIIDGISVTSLKDRTEGFMKTIQTSNIKVVAEQQTAHGRETALQSADNILQAYPNIQAFVGVNENSGMAILSAVTGANLQDVIITTVDATAENLTAIRDGKVAVGVSQDPYQMGYKAVELAVKWCAGEQIETFVEVPVEYMTQENVQQFIDRETGYGVKVD